MLGAMASVKQKISDAREPVADRRKATLLRHIR
ncbi:hypothetical protein SAMN04489717_3506 [Actinopolymorpha singaporensis]|uniref:Uncharacterized protein n=1 Tax=Actinopolymorpha singaporensis TaxID=117157 RepID=A0A1H1U719_9ACTN|nr:hypothetical protein SAMN04489717_3506 [Actinopolymorpha singaporensis]